MPRVYIPPQLRSMTGDRETVDVPGKNVREVIRHLEEKFPGIKDRLCEGSSLKPDICVAVGSSVSALGMLAPVKHDQEVHFLPIVGGG